MLIPCTYSVEVPVFDRVEIWGGVQPVLIKDAKQAKLILPGASVAIVATAPIPLSVTVCGLPAALSVTLSAAVRVPLAVGLNVTLMLQLVPPANELPQVWV